SFRLFGTEVRRRAGPPRAPSRPSTESRPDASPGSGRGEARRLPADAGVLPKGSASPTRVVTDTSRTGKRPILGGRRTPVVPCPSAQCEWNAHRFTFRFSRPSTGPGQHSRSDPRRLYGNPFPTLSGAARKEHSTSRHRRRSRLILVTLRQHCE